MSWSIGDNRNFFLMLKTKLRLYLIELGKTKGCPEKEYANSGRNSTNTRFRNG